MGAVRLFIYEKIDIEVNLSSRGILNSGQGHKRAVRRAGEANLQPVVIEGRRSQTSPSKS